MIWLWIAGAIITLAFLLPYYSMRDWSWVDTVLCAVVSLLWPIVICIIIYAQIIGAGNGRKI